MKTIMLVCAAGMSTSLLVNKMKKVAEEQSIEVEIFATSATEVDLATDERKVDALLLGPQVKYMKNQIESVLKKKNIPLGVIDMQCYGMMDGEKVLKQAFDLIDKKDL